MSFHSPLPPVEIPDLSVADFLYGDLAEDQDRPAVRAAGCPAGLTYGQLDDMVRRVADGLVALGIGSGDVVALISANSPEFVVSFHAILRAGATATTVNILYTCADISQQLTGSNARLVIADPARCERAAEACELAGLPADVLLATRPTGAGHRTIDDIAEGAPAAAPASIDPATHLAVLPFSSGTTAGPKGVMLTHANLVANTCQLEHQLGLTSASKVLAILPLFHIYGMTVLMHAALSRRAALVTMEQFDLAEFLATIEEDRITHVFIAPPVAVALAKHPSVDDHDLSSLELVFSGAAPLDAALAEAVAQRLGCRVRQGYGMTEMSPVSHAIPFERSDISIGSVGLTVPNMECKILDPETGEEVAVPARGASVPGELCCKGPNVMVGYLGDPEATRAAIDDDGFLHTGDLATVSADGSITIVDRLKELIKYKGYQVAPAELEALLLTHADVLDAAVVGALDPGTGEEVPKAFVVARPDRPRDPAALMAFVEGHVSPHKKVRLVEFIDTIPKSATGKILRKNLRG